MTDLNEGTRAVVQETSLDTVLLGSQAMSLQPILQAPLMPRL